MEPWVNPKKYRKGQSLVFLRYNPQEVDCVPSSTFRSGDRLTVQPRNGCGMGIDVLREDGVCDMVWPEEVAVALVAPVNA
jgi:hypothetical protein